MLPRGRHCILQVSCVTEEKWAIERTLLFKDFHLSPLAENLVLLYLQDGFLQFPLRPGPPQGAGH